MLLLTSGLKSLSRLSKALRRLVLHQLNWIFRPPEVLIIIGVSYIKKSYSRCWSGLESSPTVESDVRSPPVRHRKSVAADRSVVGLGGTGGRLHNPSVDPLCRFAGSKRSHRPRWKLHASTSGNILHGVPIAWHDISPIAAGRLARNHEQEIKRINYVPFLRIRLVETLRADRFFPARGIVKPLHDQSGSPSELLTAKGLLQSGDGNVRPSQTSDRIRALH
jgi:hypothetical protein